MKSIIREYIAGLKERTELDVMLPDLLSELGFTVLTRPSIGTRQYGVDVAAVSPKKWEGGRKLYLFSIKAGDLDRNDWDVGPQALRPSLNEIKDTYITKHVPSEYKKLEKVICIAVGGEVTEAISPNISGYIDENRTKKRSYQTWNGDRIAGYIAEGILSEKVFEGEARKLLRKSIALLEEPDASFGYFVQLVDAICEPDLSTDKKRVRAIRQLSLATWMLFVWARDGENIESAYLASERVLLRAWPIVAHYQKKKTKSAKAVRYTYDNLINLHVHAIADDFLHQNVLPLVGKRHALSHAVQGQASLDVNLKLFDLLGRMSMQALWLLREQEELGEKDGGELVYARAEEIIMACAAMIENNPSLNLPACDHQTTDIALFVTALGRAARWPEIFQPWLSRMTARLDFTIRTRQSYPTVESDYRMLARARRQDDEGYEAETSGSTFVPFLAVLLRATKAIEGHAKLIRLVDSNLQHSTLQLWLPNEGSELNIYGGKTNGTALTGLQLSSDGSAPLQHILKACQDERGLENLSAFRFGLWPIVLLACRHYRFPVPPQFWEGTVISDDAEAEGPELAQEVVSHLLALNYFSAPSRMGRNRTGNV